MMPMTSGTQQIAPNGRMELGSYFNPLEVDVELINHTFDGSSNLTKNMGND